MVVPLVAAISVSEVAFAEPSVSEAELASMRGGFSTPGGLEIAIAVQTDTKIDGSLVLRTVFRVDQGPASLAAYAPARSIMKGDAGDTGTTKTNPVPAPVNVTYDRSNGIRFVGATATGPTVVLSDGKYSTIAAAPAGTGATALTRDGPVVAVAQGLLSVRSLGIGSRITLQGGGTDVSHLVGSAFGSVIANTVNDRAIDTTTSIALDISGANFANLGSALLQVDTLGGDTAALMVPR